MKKMLFLFNLLSYAEVTVPNAIPETPKFIIQGSLKQQEQKLPVTPPAVDTIFAYSLLIILLGGFIGVVKHTEQARGRFVKRDKVDVDPWFKNIEIKKNADEESE
jgi:hypothetical protein